MKDYTAEEIHLDASSDFLRSDRDDDRDAGPEDCRSSFHVPAGRTVKRPLLEKAVEAYSVFTPAKMSVLEIEDVNTIWFREAKGRDSEES